MQAQYLLALIYIIKKLKAGNYSEKPKNEISQLLYSLYISKKKKKKKAKKSIAIRSTLFKHGKNLYKH